MPSSLSSTPLNTSWLLPSLLLLVACPTSKPDPLDTGGLGGGGGGSTDADGDGYTSSEDCDDNNSLVNPGAVEVCDDLDNNCDGTMDEGVGQIWYADADNDGYGDTDAPISACTQPSGYVDDDTDCDDTSAEAYPGGTEVCDALDNNCDGVTDEGVTTTFYQDVDGDSYGVADSTTESCDRPTGYSAIPGDCDDRTVDVSPAAAEVCNTVDDDCDGTVDEDDALDASTWYADKDTDGYGNSASTTLACSQPSGHVADDTDCDDGDGGVYPGAAEACNTVDDDCDGTVDEDDALDASTWYADKDTDGYGTSGTSTRSCSQPSGYVSDKTDCDDGDRYANPGADEYCDGHDDDCDGAVDEGDALDAELWFADDDTDGYGDAADMETACSQPSGYVADDTDCDDVDPGANPGEAEVCDSVDNDCDGITDEDSATDALTWYRDSDGDNYGTATTDVACTRPSGYAAASGDCDDSDKTSYPGGTEVCDGSDNDCDGTEDDGVLGTGTACPAEDCAEILADNSAATDGTYALDLGWYVCDMTTDGGGWTRVKDNAYVYGTGYDGSYYNSEGFTWDEALFAYDSGSVHAHCTYPSGLTGCNNLGFQFGSESWGVALNWGSSLCGMSTTSYTSATSYVGGYDFVISRSSSTTTIRLGTLEGIAGCTTSDNPGAAYVDVYVRR